jgi:hypothetical protein
MGNGSPRLLRHLLVRASACVVAMLWFAPPAFGDAGLTSAAGAAVPEPAVPSVGVALPSAADPAAAVPTPKSTAHAAPVAASINPATPVARSQIPVEKAISSALATPVARTPSVDRQPVAVQPTPQQRRPQRAVGSRHAASPSRLLRTTPQSAAGGIAAAARVATVSAPDVHPTRLARSGGRPVGTGRAPLPLPPAPLPIMGGAGGGTSSGGIPLLLFALAAGALILAVPRFRRRIAGALGAPRPYPYLLRLERPD